MPAIILVLLLLALLWIAFCGYRWGWGPFTKLHPLDVGRLPGNAAAYSIERVEPLAGSALKGTTIIFLGSSVTYGAASKGMSFVGHIAKRDGCTAIKEAVSGTTLADTGKSSYISRFERLDADHANSLSASSPRMTRCSESRWGRSRHPARGKASIQQP